MNYQLNYSRFDNKPSILQILADYGYYPTKRNGKYWMKCLFHEEKTASMCVYADQEKFYCFSCQQGGDSYDLLSFLSGKPLREVLRERGIELPEPAVLQKQRERLEIMRKFEAECIACWKKLVSLLHETYHAEKELQAPTDENLERLANIYFLREAIERLLNRLEDSDIQTKLKTIAEAKDRGLYDGCK